jgi:hypothetical protein
MSKRLLAAMGFGGSFFLLSEIATRYFPALFGFGSLWCAAYGASRFCDAARGANNITF